MPGSLKTLAYLGLAVVIFLGAYYVAMGVLSIFGIAFISYANRWAEYFFSGLFLLALASFLLTKRMKKAFEVAFNLNKIQRRMEDTAIEALCEHFRRIGLSATVESKEQKSLFLSSISPKASRWEKFSTHLIDALSYSKEWVLGSVRIANRNIDLVELERQQREVGSSDSSVIITEYGCNYVSQTELEGSEDKVKVSGMPVRKSLWNRGIVDFKWKGKGTELAQTLNNDYNLRNYLISQHQPRFIDIWPYRESNYIRISERHISDDPVKAFPTIETFEAYDRIAKHIRSVASTPSARDGLHKKCLDLP